MSTASSLPLRCWAEIDLAALERNLKGIRKVLPPEIKYVAVVKADAYGHGLHPTVARLMHSGADMFAVANVGEAAAVREIGPGWPILVLGSLLPEEERCVVQHDLTATISSAPEMERLEAAGKAAGKMIHVHVKIDTGMGRAGVWHTGAPALFEQIAQCPHIVVDGVFTHFSSADSDPVYTEQQRRLFIAALERSHGLETSRLMVHADNSAGLQTFEKGSPFNAVRVGLLQFGILPYEKSLLSSVDPDPVFSFHTRVGLVKTVPAGTGISYGRTHVVEKETRLAILTAGYGDGIPRACSNQASVLIHGVRCRVLGRVTMDQTVVDASNVDSVQSGDPVVLVGTQGNESISISEFSHWSATIPWETLTSVTKRVPRIYRTGLGF